MDVVKDSVFNYQYPFESDIIDVNKYFQEYTRLLIPFDCCPNEKCGINVDEVLGCQEINCKNDDFYMKFLSLSKEQLKELKETTDVHHLTCRGETQRVSHDFYKKFNEEKIKQKLKPEEKEFAETALVSVNKRVEMNILKAELPRTQFKYTNYQWCLNNEKSFTTKLDFHCPDNVVVCVKVYHPFLSSRKNAFKIKLLQEIHILGCQMLSQLRDKIICSLDFIGAKDISSECHLKDIGYCNTAKDEYPSSFIFIENTFYNDTRTSELIDLSKVIRDWAADRNLGVFKCQSMENTKICDINLKIGRPYVFQHQGNCEHVIMFSDIRFLELGDPSKLTYYPRTHCTGRLYGKHCMMCGDSYAKWFVVGNERLTHDKAYLCKKCFFSYNYIDGKKIGLFEAYKYVDPVALL